MADFLASGTAVRPLVQRGLLCALLIFLSACVTDPATERTEAEPVGYEEDRDFGARQYLSARQLHGGDYVVEPGVQQYVRDVGRRLTAATEHPFEYEITVLNTGAPNAWALPGGKIGVTRGLLLALDTEAELAAVIGHQIGHAAARHGALAMQRGTLRQPSSSAPGSDVGRYVVGPAQLAAALVSHRYSLQQEREADRYALLYLSRAGYDPQAAIELQQKLLSRPQDGAADWHSALLASHPPSADRVTASRQAAASLATGGRVGADDYVEAIAPLRATAAGYAAYEAGRRALSDGRPQEALQQADRALAVESREALFHGLRGDVAFAQGDYEQAIDDYSDALERNESYFKYYLGRGEAWRRLGQLTAAREDLSASVALLPTADAATALGQIAETDDRNDEAIGWYQAAAASATPAGHQAVARLLSLDLPQQPERYVSADVKVDRTGRVYVELVNRTPLALEDVRLLVGWRDASGAIGREPRQYGQRLAPGDSGIIMLGADYVDHLNSLRALVTAARAAEWPPP